MHESVRDWVMRNTRKVADTATVLEVGSANVNGTVRDLFAGKYTGIDHEDADGVDLVASSHDLAELFDPDSFDLVLCLEMLEHDPNPFVTVQQIAGVVKPGGTVILTARANGFPEHNRPDLWRFMKDGMRALVDAAGLTLVRLEDDPQVSGWLVVATKPEAAEVPKPAGRKKKAA